MRMALDIAGDCPRRDFRVVGMRVAWVGLLAGCKVGRSRFRKLGSAYVSVPEEVADERVRARHVNRWNAEPWVFHLPSHSPPRASKAGRLGDPVLSILQQA